MLRRSRALHDEFAIVRVVPQWLRYYDAGPESFRVVEGCWSDCQGDEAVASAPAGQVD